MTQAATGNLATVLDNHDERLTALEQKDDSSAPSALTGPVEVTDPDTGYVAILDVTPPDVPTGVVATPGTFFDDIFVDVEWAGTGNSYEVELAEHTIGPPETRDLIDLSVVYATTTRFTALKPNKTYSVRVTAVSPLGIHSAASDWVDFATGADTTVPGAPTGLQTFRSADAIIASWDENPESDVAHAHGLYLVQLSTDDFATILSEYRISATVVAFEGLTTEANYKVRVAAIDSSGNQSPFATSAATLAGSIITTQIKDDAITTPKIIAGAVTATQIAAATITAAKIAVGTITGDRISANTITGDKITTSDLTTATITLNGGALKAGNPPTTGLLMNSQGLRLYQGGVQTIALDAATGNATFSGTVSGANITATSTIQGSTISGAHISGGTVDGVTITGGVIQTANTAPRIRMLYHPWTSAPIMTGAGVNPAEYLEFHTGWQGGTADDYWPGVISAQSFSGASQMAVFYIQAPRPLASHQLPPQIMMENAIAAATTSIWLYGHTTIIYAQGVNGGTLQTDGVIQAGNVYTAGGHYFNGNVTVSGSLSVGSLSLSGTLTCTAVSATGGTSFFAAISVSSVASTGGIQATSFTASSGSSSLRGISNNNNGISNTGAISQVTTISASSTITGSAFSATGGTSFFQGIVGTTLAISGAKMFVIPHPLDPTLALSHAAMEGPEMGVYYRGQDTIGQDGTVIVTLPRYFEALTLKKNRTVQLTAISDGKQAQPMSATVPANGTFTVSGKAGQKFFWRVEAVRGDIEELWVEPKKTAEYWFDERPVSEDVEHEEPEPIEVEEPFVDPFPADEAIKEVEKKVKERQEQFKKDNKDKEHIDAV